MSVKHRASAVLGGGFFVMYGWYVAHQTSGTFEFPVVIFVIPVLAVIYLLIRVYRSLNDQPGATGTGDPDGGHPSGPGD